MSTTHELTTHPAVTAPSHSARPDLAAPISKAEIYALAEKRMRRGKRLVTGGFVVAILGMVGYCVACLSAAINPDIGATFLVSPAWLTGPALGVVGLGTLLWLVGSFLYLVGGMDSDPDGPELYF